MEEGQVPEGATTTGQAGSLDRWEEIERVGLTPQPSDFSVNAFGQCATAGCLFELYARRYADNTPELQAVAFKDLSVVVEAIRTHVLGRTTDEERAVLDACVGVRNKLFHLELSRVTGRLRSFGAEIGGPKVTMVNLADGAAIKVANSSTRDGRIYGWLMEATANGAFKQGVALFKRGIALFGWLLMQDAGDEKP
jgi:hypothetical protein